MALSLILTACGRLPFGQEPQYIIVTPTAEGDGILSDIFATGEVVTPRAAEMRSMPFLAEMSGSVDEFRRDPDSVHEAIYPGDDTRNNADFEGFITFDISTINSNGIIEKAEMSFGECTTHGFPFAAPPFGLGPLSVEYYAYGELGVEDYLGGPDSVYLFDVEQCPLEPLDVTLPVRTFADASLFQLRLYFPGSNGDNFRDDVTFVNPQLRVDYIPGT